MIIYNFLKCRLLRCKKPKNNIYKLNKLTENGMVIIKECRMCKSNELELFLDLGFHPPSDAFLTKEQLDMPEIYYPLTVYTCKKCGLMQLGYVVPAEILYNKNFPYDSSMTLTGKNHFFEMSRDVCERFKLRESSLVIDVGSNVGVLLQGFREQGMKVLGVDPAIKIAEIANANGIETWANFFNYETAKKILKLKGKAAVITATNVFAHIGNLDDFMKAVELLLADDGCFVFEAPYFVDLLENLEYDTIYHEHLCYISVKPLTFFFPRFGMEIFDIKKVAIHGGSLRVFIGRKGKRSISENVEKFLELEKQKNIYSLARLNAFAEEVKNHSKELFGLIYNLKKEGKRIVGLSAPAKGNTLLNFCGLNKNHLDYVTEKSKIKIGLFCPGTHLQVVPDEELQKDRPDYALLLAWNFSEEIMKNMKSFKEAGGKFIIPIPKPRIV